MTTVADVIERLRRTWLEPPDYQPPTSFLGASITSTAQSLTLSGFLIDEDEQLLATGSIIEISSELMRVIEYDSVTSTATVQRGTYGTTAAVHAAGDVVYLSPSFPRLSMFEAVADSIITLSPQLYTVRAAQVSTVEWNVAPMTDDLAIRVLTAWPDAMYDYNVPAYMVDYHPATGGRAVVFQGVSGGSYWVRYARRMMEATSETDTLEELGVESRWVNIVMAGAAADLYAGRDLPASKTDWVGAALEAESVPVGSRYQIASALSGYRDRILKKAADEMDTEYPVTMRIRSPFE